VRVSDKNLDVDRAIASVGGERWTYYSFKPVLTHAADTGVDSLFTYNELGEPEYAAQHLQLPPPSEFASPDDEYLEDAAYPEAHPHQTWDDVPAPADHTARFIAPAPATPPTPIVLAPVAPQVVLQTPVPAARPAFAAPAVAVVNRPAYVPFLASALPQASVHTSAQLYRPAERAAESARERSPAPPQSDPIVVTQARAPAAAFPAPAVAPTFVTPPAVAVAAIPLVAPRVIAQLEVGAPVASARVPTPLVAAAPKVLASVVAPSVAQPAYRPAPPPRASLLAAEAAIQPASASRASQPSSAGVQTTPYPQPFVTLADMYARLARTAQVAAAAAPNPPAPVEVDEQKMFRRL
jgi:hypothetical protein